MILVKFIVRQFQVIKSGEKSTLLRKFILLTRELFRIPLYILAIPSIFFIRLISPWLLVRFEGLISSRIGHFAANTELYLCERAAKINVPNKRYVDIIYMNHLPICNKQLAIMWRRVLHFWPTWLALPIDKINRLIPGGLAHRVGRNIMNDQDVNNLFERFFPHLKFTDEETLLGENSLRAMGIPKGAPYVCLTVRDSAYLSGANWAYHNYRDTDIQNYVLGVEALAERGYYVIRMGAKVHSAINTSHSMVIDYATNGMRTDFMDIYLGANCTFAISTATGWDAIPYIFRKPIAYVNLVPLGYHLTYRKVFLAITKHYYCGDKGRNLTISEIFDYDLAYAGESCEYDSKNITLVENTPVEIKDLLIEMAERVAGRWSESELDQCIQNKFWDLFPQGQKNSFGGMSPNSQMRSNRIGTKFLRDNAELLG